MVLSYWSWIGTFYLLWLTIQDYRNNMLVDDRKNYFMLGLSISLYSHLRHNIIYVLLLIVTVMILNKLFRKTKAMGEADINSISWMFLGFGIISPFALLWFSGIFMLLLIMYTFFKVKVFKNTAKAPFYYVLLLTFIISCWLTGVY